MMQLHLLTNYLKTETRLKKIMGKNTGLEIELANKKKEVIAKEKEMMDVRVEVEKKVLANQMKVIDLEAKVVEKDRIISSQADEVTDLKAELEKVQMALNDEKLKSSDAEIRYRTLTNDENRSGPIVTSARLGDREVGAIVMT
ncbi:hypothetical protein A4A49_38803 [Nicotiana attenuata]|uniref:Uncharacterized protein n=1 Tax=Nicotiana attenuata TaxID=49451 RepID=A0A1J6KQH0_NICAT|nr:hypothetical protein A4A49_38803 [Nicotiana attenuata]